MKDSTLLIIALAVFVIGMAGLVVTAKTITVDEATLDAIDELPAEQMTRVDGVVERLTEKGNVTIMVISQQTLVTVVAFDDKVSVKKGDRIGVEGTIEEYNGKKEIIAEKIERIK